MNLALLEFFPIIFAVEILGSALRNRRVCFYSDNVGVVYRSTSSSPLVLSLLWHLILRCLQHNIWFRARHVPRVCISASDALTSVGRNFRSAVQSPLHFGI